MNEETAKDNLSPRVYTVEFSKMGGFYLSMTKDLLEVPKRIYGNSLTRVKKCIDTYRDRTASTGILLTGDKGTGKTLLMSLLANKVITDLGLPVILVKDAYAGSQFTSFIEDIGECCLIFDEFGKMYESSDRHVGEGKVSQQELLSLMDGVDKTKRMFIFTENSQLDINEFMMNRPSRIYYHFKYKKLDESSIVGYCEDHGRSKEVIKDIIDISRRSRVFSFDMLQSIVEEQKRYEQSVEEVVQDLNIDLREESGAMIEIQKIIERETEKEMIISKSPFVQKPEGQYGGTYVYFKPDEVSENKNVKRAESDDDDDDNYVYIRLSDMAYESNGQVVYQTDKYLVVAKDVPQRNLNLSDLLL